MNAENGRFFVKAIRNRPGGRRDSLVREGLINAFVRSVTPDLLWEAEDDEWFVLGFEYAEARHADFSPGSSDLPVVVDLLDRVTDLRTPEIAREWPETRWDRFAPFEERALFAGEDLLHTDIHPNNFLLGDDGCWLVDWAWPTTGAGFIDSALLVVQLIATDHTPASAESWASRCRAWQKAVPAAVDAFASANLRMLRASAERSPEATWRKAMADAAQAWTDHRGLTVEPLTFGA
ncbi:protein kinase [Spirillospora sp. NPDC052269]